MDAQTSALFQNVHFSLLSYAKEANWQSFKKYYKLILTKIIYFFYNNCVTLKKGAYLFGRC